MVEKSIITGLLESLGATYKKEFDKLEYKVIALNKNDYLVKEGDHFIKFSHIISGGLRKFYLGKNGKEFTTTFCLPGGFAAPFPEIIDEVASSVNIQAIVNSRVAVFDFQVFKKVTEDLGLYAILHSEILISLLKEKEEREKALLLLDAKDRIQWLRQKYPNIFNLTTKRNIATYLAIDPSTLSRALN